MPTQRQISSPKPTYTHTLVWINEWKDDKFPIRTHKRHWKMPTHLDLDLHSNTQTQTPKWINNWQRDLNQRTHLVSWQCEQKNNLTNPGPSERVCDAMTNRLCYISGHTLESKWTYLSSNTHQFGLSFCLSNVSVSSPSVIWNKSFKNWFIKNLYRFGHFFFFWWRWKIDFKFLYW